MFTAHALGIMAAEAGLHDSFFADFGITRAEAEQAAMAPTNLAYTSYLLRVAYVGVYAELLGALLPCYWIYQEVGRVLIAHGSPNPLHQRWIATYGGEEYGAAVTAVLAEVDRVAAAATDAQRAAMREAFVIASRYEWMFWQMGWDQEAWPI
jgi:thiaminase/transcriptional activator TenA